MNYNNMSLVGGKREITKEQYERAKPNRNYIAVEDMADIFTVSELYGYGVYGARACKEDDKYYVYYSIGNSCD